MTQKGMQRAINSHYRPSERESQRRRRELERQSKEMAKLSAIEQARLEVETFENSLDVLLSIHKEPRENWDWISIAAELTPPEPLLDITAQVQTLHNMLANYAGGDESVDVVLQRARNLDEREYRLALAEHESVVSNTESLRQLAYRILDGESLAYLEAFAQFNPVAEFSSAGSLRQFAVGRKDLVDWVFEVDFESTIPSIVKSLTSTGKLSVKPMPKARRHELYQDYVASCTLRMAGEIFAMLPVETVLVTALTDSNSEAPDLSTEIPILSVIFNRPGLEQINFETTSPTEAIDQFQPRCNFKITRGTGKFQPIMPLTVSDAATSAKEHQSLNQLLTLIRELQDEIRPSATIVRSKPNNTGEFL